MTTPATDPAAPYHDLLAAIRDALDIPVAALADIDAEQQLTAHRTFAVNSAVQLALTCSSPDGIAREAERLRTRIDQLPVTYRRQDQIARNHPADCTICGPGCCRPILGIHVGDVRPEGGNFKLLPPELQVAPSPARTEAADVR